MKRSKTHHGVCYTCEVKLTSDNCTKSTFLNQYGPCRGCSIIYQKEYYHRNPSKHIAESVAWNRKKKFGTTQEEFDLRFANQKGLCSICQQPMIVGKTVRRPCQDHNHVTGQLRDLLCSRCNTFLGLSSENIDILSNAISYLKRHADGSSIKTICEGDCSSTPIAS
jgi:hypothetical protein